MFGEDGAQPSSDNDQEQNAYVDKVATHNKYKELKFDY